MEWISCLDRMPQNAAMVLGWVRKAGMCKVVVRSRIDYSDSRELYHWIGDEVEGDEETHTEHLPDDAISHWAHLPNPPGAD